MIPVRTTGAIGTVIGHEISHSFDDQGSQFDAEGRLANWWTPEDIAHFQAAAKKLVAQYDAYEPLPGLHVNGKLTLSENIADVAGVSAAYDGYRAAYASAPPPAIEGFSRRSAFLSRVRAGLAEQGPARDDAQPAHHRRPRSRANTAPTPSGTSIAWYAAFGVKPGQALYLDPEARVRVW